MKSLRSYLRVALPLIILVLSVRVATVVYAGSSDITISASTSSDNNVQLSGNVPVPYDNSGFTWKWYSSSTGGGSGTLLTSANGGPADTSSIDTTTDEDAPGTYCDTITVIATPINGTGGTLGGSTQIGVTWDANGNATVQSSCASTTTPPTTGTGTTGTTGTITTPPTSTGTSCGTDTQICNPVSGVTDITGLIVSLIKYMLGIIGIIAVLMIIYGGYQMVLSSGNEEEVKKGRQTITYAVVGLVLAVLSYSIVSIVENLVRNQATTTSSAVMVIAPISNIVGVHVAYAASTACSTDNGLSQVSSLFPAQYCSAPSTLTLVINTLLGFLGIVSVLYIIIGGYRMVVSNGNDEAFTTGRQTVLYAVIGLIVAVFAFAIISIVGKLVVSGSSTTSTNPTSTTPTSTANPTIPTNTANPIIPTTPTTNPVTTPTSPTTPLPPYIAAPSN